MNWSAPPLKTMVAVLLWINNQMYVGALLEQVVPLSTNLLLLELPTGPQHGLIHIIDCGLEHSPRSLGNPNQILNGHPARTENAPIRKPLCRQIPNRQLGQHHLRSNLMHFLELIVDDPPLGIDNALEVLDILDPHLSVLLLGLQFEFDLEDQDFGVFEALWLLLETGIREGL